MSVQAILYKVEDIAGKKVKEVNAVAGGCIAQTNKILFEDDSHCFLKTGAGHPDTFQKEANGLRELAKTNCIRVPEVLAIGEDYLLLEYIEEGIKRPGFFAKFGEQLAQMHSRSDLKFGFKEDNYIGSTMQPNIAKGVETKNWIDFYYNKRLLYQYKLAEKNKLVGNELKNGYLVLEHRIEEILEGSEEKPSLIHGDLWSGNYMCDIHSNPVLIDPAVYYGHREAEMAMTKLFGGFPEEFYRAYLRTKPLPQGYDYRENIYLLYHVLNHLNLFGSSYYGQAVRLVWSYLH